MVQRIRNASSQPWRTTCLARVQRPRPSSRLRHWSTEPRPPKTSLESGRPSREVLPVSSPLRPRAIVAPGSQDLPRSSCFCQRFQEQCAWTNLDGRQSLQTVRQSSARGLPHRTASIQEPCARPKAWPAALSCLPTRFCARWRQLSTHRYVLLPQELP